MSAPVVQVLILDVEGVVVQPGGSQYPWPLRSLLKVREALESAPFACVLCTGRQEPYGEAVIQALNLFRSLPEDLRARARERGAPDLLAWPSILENGAYFYDPIAKRAIPHPALDGPRIERIRRLRAERLIPLANRTGALIEPGKDYSVSLNPPMVSEDGRRQSTDEFRPLVEAALRGFEDEVEIKHSASAVDVTPHGVNKASAVRLLRDWLNLPVTAMAGVGDTYADAAWLTVVGWRAAPANGRSALPELDFYAGRDVADGLLDIIDFLLTQRQ